MAATTARSPARILADPPSDRRASAWCPGASCRDVSRVENTPHQGLGACSFGRIPRFACIVNQHERPAGENDLAGLWQQQQDVGDRPVDRGEVKQWTDSRTSWLQRPRGTWSR